MISVARPGSVRGLVGGATLAVLLSACGGGGGGVGGPVTFSLSTTTVSFSAVTDGPAPAAQTVTATAMNGTVYFSIQASGHALVTATPSCAGSACQITLTPISPLGAGTGTYTSTVVVTGCTAQLGCGSQVTGRPQTITVSYTMAAGPTLPGTPTGIGVQTTPSTAAPAQTIALAASVTSATAWQSSVSYVAGGNNGWLTVAPTGSAPGNVQIGVGALPAGSYRAVVTFAPAGGGNPAKILVVAVAHNGGARYVSPYVATAGSSGKVILRGSGFSALSAAQTQVLVGANAVTGVRVVSDTEITATVPVLGAGRYAVTVKDNSQTLAGNPILLVVAPPA